MTATIVRLILAMLILPVTATVFILTIIATTPRSGGPTGFSLALVWCVVYSEVAIYWVLLWRSSVRWTRRRIMRTLAVSAAAMMFGSLVALLGQVMLRGAPGPIYILFGGGTVPIVWVLGTVLVWRETHAERIARLASIGATVVCPMCGYNMAGLKTAVCPECGGAFTLDQFVAAQPRQAQRVDAAD